MVLLSYCIYKGGAIMKITAYSYGISIAISECMLLALIFLKFYISIYSFISLLLMHTLAYNYQ